MSVYFFEQRNRRSRSSSYFFESQLSNIRFCIQPHVDHAVITVTQLIMQRLLQRMRQRSWNDTKESTAATLVFSLSLESAVVPSVAAISIESAHERHPYGSFNLLISAERHKIACADKPPNRDAARFTNLKLRC